MAERMEVPNRRAHVTQKARIAGRRVVYLSVGGGAVPNEVFIRIKGPEVSAELVCLHDVIARLISLMIQEGIPLESIAERLHGTRCEPAGPVEGDARIKMCDGLMDYIGRHLLVWYCRRDDLAHVAASVPEEGGAL